MRLTSSVTGLPAAVLAVAIAVASTGITAASAGEDKSSGPSCTCPSDQDKSTKRKFTALDPSLDEGDEIAALQSVQLALSQIADGSNFVWRRNNGHLAGLVKPTSSFRNAAGAICRHVVVMLTTGVRTEKTEGIACRRADGVWQLEG
jgi:surface antigen